MFDEIKWLHAFTKYITQNFAAKPHSVNELILTPFSPFDIKYKKVNAKNLWKLFLRDLGW